MCSFPDVNAGGTTLHRGVICMAACLAYLWTACTVQPPQGVFVCQVAQDCPDGQQCFAQRCWSMDPQKGMSSSWVGEAGGASQGGRGAPDSCRDAVLNGEETDVDCGGSMCPTCQGGKACARDRDCQPARCVSGRCQTDASCMDGVKNKGESDVDCGGACGRCADARACATGSDCMSAVCNAGKCAAASCMDVVQNGAESDVDCGGVCPKKCALQKRCTVGVDCESGRCAGNVCAAASCSDAQKNASETDVDCGGACPKCADGRTCAASADCQSGLCQMTCQPVRCWDRAKNGMETDLDCGGGHCPGCGAGGACNATTDCAGGLSCEAGHCRVIAGCMDGVKNGQETGVDCGGVCACCPTYEIKADVQSANGWFGGDSRPQLPPRSEGTGTSVLVRNAGTLSRFAFYFTETFRDGAGKAHDTTLRLQIRDAAGKMMQGASVNVPASFKGGYVFWDNLGFKLTAGTTYIFTAYLENALMLGAWSGYAADSAQGYVDGKGYAATVTDADATFEDWSSWQEQAWDRRFWLQACP